MDWKEIKSDAKECIKGNRGKVWGYLILSSIIIILIMGIFVVLISVFNGVFGKIQIVSTIVTVVLGVMMFITMLGLMGAYMTGLMSNLLEIYDGMSADVGRMFQYTKNLFSCAGLMWGFMWRCLIPIVNLITYTKVYAAFCIKSEKTYMKGHFCWKEAGKVMNGYKMNFFLFLISFIPQIFIGMLLFPLGIYWIPYIFEAIAIYYANIVGAGYDDSIDLGIDTTPMGEDEIVDAAPPNYKKEKPVKEPKQKKEKLVKEPKQKKERPVKEPKAPKEKKGLRPTQ